MRPAILSRPARQSLFILLAVLAASLIPAAANLPAAGAVPATAALSGRVTNTTGSGIGSVTVTAYAVGGLEGSAQATTRSDGTYTVTGLNPAGYTVRFSPPPGSRYLGRYFQDDQSACGGLLFLAAGDQRTGVDAVLAAGASFTGRVTDAAGAPLAGVSVSALGTTPGQNTSPTATTAADGTYTVKGLAAGAYKVTFLPPADSWALAEYFGDTQAPDQAATVTVAGTERRTGIDAVLAAGAGISGVVNGTGKGPLAGVTVSVSPITGGGLSGWKNTTTAADGTYTVPGLPPGSYQVSFAPPNGAPFAGQYYAGRTQWDSADPVTVGSGEHRSGIDASLAPAARLSGTVRGPGGAPLAGITVSVSTAGGGGISSWASTATAADGTWAAGGLAAGSYTVTFAPPYGSIYLGEQYDDKGLGAVADPVTAVAGEDRSGLDAVLAVGASIAGTVTGPGSSPLSGVAVSATTSGSPYSYGSATTAADGSYTIVGLAPASFTVSFRPLPSSGLMAENYNDRVVGQAADPVVLAAGQRRSGVDAALALGASISGTVRTAAGAPVAGAPVSVQGTTPTGGFYGATTGADGSYTVPGLPAGAYKVQFSPRCSGDGYASQWYDNQAGTLTATTLTLVAGERRTGIDAVLGAEATISGIVRGDGGVGLGSVSVTVNGPGFGSAATAADGTYTVRGLPPGSYTVTFSPGYGGDYAAEYWNDQTSLGAATPVTVAAGEHRTSIDATLTRGAAIAGRVTGPAGEPVAGATVGLTNGGSLWLYAITNGDGTYRFSGLGTDQYRLQFTPPSPYVGEYWNDATSPSTATWIGLSTGQQRTGVDAVLAKLASLSGTVTSRSGAPAVGVNVAVQGPVTVSAVTGSDGRYSVAGLPPGQYQVRFSTSDGSYFPEYYDNAPDTTTAQTITLAAGAARTGVDATLDRPGGVTGTVTNSAGSPYGGVAVTVTGPAGDVHHATTAGTGAYSIGGLRAGAYTIDFDPLTLLGAAPVTGVAATVTDGTWSTVDARIPDAGQIAGKIVSATEPSVGAVTVEALDPNGRVVATTTVDATGAYTLRLVPVGTYVVHAVPAPGNAHKSKYYKNSKTFAGADRVTVAMAQTTKRINIRLRT